MRITPVRLDFTKSGVKTLAPWYEEAQPFQVKRMCLSKLRWKNDNILFDRVQGSLLVPTQQMQAQEDASSLQRIGIKYSLLGLIFQHSTIF